MLCLGLSMQISSAPYIMCELFKLDNNYRTYLKGVMLSEYVLRRWIKPTLFQKSFELTTGAESMVVKHLQ